MRRAAAFVLALLAPAKAQAEEAAPPPKILAAPDDSYRYESPRVYPSLLWFATQMVPSPEVGIGRTRSTDVAGATEDRTQVAFGLRWQLTPALWSWGVHRRIDRWRFFVVDPLARSSGSLELDLSGEYLWGHVDRLLVRPGVRATFPLVQRGEYLSMSMGTSMYQYDDAIRVAYGVGAYVLFGMLGAEVTIAPTHNPLMTLATLRLRYF